MTSSGFIFRLASSFGLAALLTGCTLTDTASPDHITGSSLAGNVHGGQQPVVGAKVFLFAASSTGYGTASVSLLTASGTNTFLDNVASDATYNDYYVTTDANGSFTITNDYSCMANTQVYLYVVGGNPGSGTNSGSGFLAALGNCPSTNSFAASIPFVFMNEISTVAAAYSFAGYATDALHVASSGTPLALVGIQNAFANAANLASISTGNSLTATPAVGSNGVVPYKLVNTIADILSFCVNSYDAAPSPTPCSQLFALSKNGNVAPSDTATAAINIAHNPGVNVSGLFGLVPSNPPYTAVSSVPNDFLLGITFTGGGLDGTRNVQIDGYGNVWIGNLTNNSVSEFSPSGVPLSGTTGYTSSQFSSVYAIGIDLNNNVWVANFGTNSISELSNAGAVISPSAYAGGTNMNEPYYLAIDGNNGVWINNINSNYIFDFNATTLAYTNTTGYTGFGQGSQRAIAIDQNENVWEANSGTTSGITEIANAGTAVTGTGTAYTDGGCTAPGAGAGIRSIAVDKSGNVWAPNETNNALCAVTSSGGVYATSGTGFTGGGLSTPAFIAFDGNNNAWIANSGAHTISEFTDAGVALSPSTGFTGGGIPTLTGPHGIAIDGSGNVWVLSAISNGGNVVEFVGAGAPVVTPMSQAIKSKLIGQMP